MAKPKSPAPAKPTRKAKKHDPLTDMLVDVNEKLHAIGRFVAELQTHGDLHDGHIDLAKNAKKLAKEAHASVKAIRKGG